jgi:subtilisin family serine protease
MKIKKIFLPLSLFSCIIFSIFSYQFSKENFTLTAYAQKDVMENNKDDAIYPAAPLQKTPRQPENISNQLIIQYHPEKITSKKTMAINSKEAIKQRHKLEKIDEIASLNIELVSTAEDNLDDVIQKIKTDPAVLSVEKNKLRTPAFIPNDAYYDQQWHLHNENDYDIDAPEAWDVEKTLSLSNTIIAVIDTGARLDHEDLTGSLWSPTSCKDDTGGLIPSGCPNHGWDYADDDNNPTDEGDADGNSVGHGTHVSGIIGAVQNNTLGISGISANNKLKVMPIRFAYDIFTEIKSINFAIQNGAKVINASYGGYDYSEAEKNTIAAFNGIFVTAAGNGGDDTLGDDNDTTPVYPCNYNLTNIICVTATDQNDNLAEFSNYGDTSVDIAAPGVNMLSTFSSSPSSYATGSGTSMAAPLAAGAAAAIFSMKPTATISDVRTILLNTGDTLESLQNKVSTAKRLNLKNAFNQANILDSTPPVRTNASPGGTLSYSTTQTNLSLNTNESASCRYSNNPNTPYNSMPFTFSLTGATAHNTLLSGLNYGQNYAYYVRCIDSAGNANNDDYPIPFAIESHPPVINNPTLYIDKKRKYTLNTAKKFPTRKKSFLFYGTVDYVAGGRVEIYQGRKSWKKVGQVAIGADGYWVGRVKTSKKNYLFKMAYYDQNGSLIGETGNYYLKVGRKK